MDLLDSIQKLNDEINRTDIKPEVALGDDLFLFASSLLPLVNVDLLVFDKNGRILLSWRDDKWAGMGWHFPGRCVRLRETLYDAARKCSLEELKTETFIQRDSVKTYEIIYPNVRQNLENQRERVHTIAFAFVCLLPDDFKIDNGSVREGNPGFLKMFDDLPPDLLSIHDCYKRDWEDIKRRIYNV